MTSKDMWYLVAGFILSRLLSMPFQLASGLLFPSVQRWFEAKMKARAFEKSKRMREEYEEAHYFFTYPHRMTQYFLNRGLELFRLSLFLLVALWALTRIPFGAGPQGIWRTISVFAAFGGTAFLLFSISGQVNKLHDIYYRAEFWGEYKKKVERELPDLVQHNDSITPAKE